MVRRSEFDAVVQRLAQFEAFVQSQLGMRMDFGANTSQAPPPPPPQEHHQQVGMDPACSPQQQHDDDDKDNPDWVDDEHLVRTIINQDKASFFLSFFSIFLPPREQSPSGVVAAPGSADVRVVTAAAQLHASTVVVRLCRVPHRPTMSSC
ncbi:hypothetical protein Scep_005023 [Stephania cephalantha]|uniref:Uncharacterized protein n=1 Tax=Stephania cephalantha TaxID=152367 RepID=A0AAP0KV49_9MAGN